MITVGVVVPTMSGREKSLERALESLSSTLPEGYELDVTMPTNYASCGEAWNEGRKDVEGEYLYFMADDVVLHPGWLETCIETVDAGYIPAARQLLQDGSLEGCGSMGYGRFLPESDDWTPCRNTGLIFMRAEWWNSVGEFLPVHYSTDDDWTWRASLKGINVAYRSGYVFTHFEDRTASQGVRGLAPKHLAAHLLHVTQQRYSSEVCH